MILDRNNHSIKAGDKVKNLDTSKKFIFTEEMEMVLNHCELLPKNRLKIWKYNHLEKIEPTTD